MAGGPPEFDRILERMREANRSPEVRDFPGWKAERVGWFRQASGGIEEQWHLPGGTHLRVVAQPLPDGGLLMIFEDRTEEVQLASARDTLLRVRTATFDNLFEALGVFAADGRLQLWNNRFRALWGLEEDFLTSHPRVDAFADRVAERLATPGRSALIVDLVRSATIERQQRGGRVAFADGRHFEFAGVPLPDGNALFTLLDITDSRRAEQALRDRADALEAADKVKTAFVANMSYELRTPLTSISGFAEMLHGGFAGPLPETATGYVEAILESTERLGLLVDDVLDLTRDQADGGIAREDVEMARVARAAADTIRPIAARRKLDFAVEMHRSLGRVTGDRRRLQETIEHLLRHAVEQTPEGASCSTLMAMRCARGSSCPMTGRAWTGRRWPAPSIASPNRASRRRVNARWVWACRWPRNSSRRMAAPSPCCPNRARAHWSRSSCPGAWWRRTSHDDPAGRRRRDRGFRTAAGGAYPPRRCGDADRHIGCW